MFVKGSCDDETNKIIEESTGGYVDESFLSMIVSLAVFYISHDYFAFNILICTVLSGAAASSDENYSKMHQDQDEMSLVALIPEDGELI